MRAAGESSRASLGSGTPPLPPSSRRKKVTTSVTPPTSKRKLRTPTKDDDDPATPSSSRQRRGAENDEQDGSGSVRRVLSVASAFNVEDADTPISRGYFEAKSKGAARKSAKKIADIEVVEEQDLREALKSLQPKHEAELASLLDCYKASYNRWLVQLQCGFGLLMYGFGSKRTLIEDFALATFDDGAVVVLNGYLPTVNMKEVLLTMANVLTAEASDLQSLSLEELLSFLTDYNGNEVVYLIIHNIDGPALRDGAIQQLLANVAACSQVYVVASIDNINAPLLWDKRMANTQFNWWWIHTPTYAAYTVEASSIPLILATSGVNESVRSAILVLRSLTPNAQSVFRLLADHQLANSEDEGLTQHQLYTKCREKFLVSSELTLRAHLTEFRDHQLVKVRRGSDGQDCLYITLPPDALSKLVEDLNL